ncbi:MAG: citrate/2-methylcitrate synthase [Capsulimonadaceae bacterium]|nr:citrate/2-methylcitrate synthase [Capsulimonadaceae bacterium]
MSEPKTFKEGLEDVIAGESSITDVNGTEGKLIFRGYDIHDLALNSTFEEIVFLLWNDDLPNRSQLEALGDELDANRTVPAEAMRLIKQFPAGAPPMDLLRTAVSLLAFYDPDTGDNSIPANRRKAVRLTAQMGTLVAALARLSMDRPIIEPVSGKSTAWNFLYMLTGDEPDHIAEHALDVALVLHADHELNASTFAARVAVGTLSDMYSGVTAALGALAGPLHGGANVEVMHMLEQIGDPREADRFVEDALASGRKLMGIGHRVYKTLDPRAVSLRYMSRQLAESSGNRKWYDISEAVEGAAEKALAAKGKSTLKANVDFFSASVYHVLGIPTEFFTPVFAVSRISGLTAHILEQLGNNKLIRPRAIYTGPESRKVMPLVHRG